MKKPHVTKPTAGIKMPHYHTQKLPQPAKQKPEHISKPQSAKRPTSPSVRLPTIPQHREKLAGMVPPAPKKGK